MKYFCDSSKCTSLYLSNIKINRRYLNSQTTRLTKIHHKWSTIINCCYDLFFCCRESLLCNGISIATSYLCVSLGVVVGDRAAWILYHRRNKCVCVSQNAPVCVGLAVACSWSPCYSLDRCAFGQDGCWNWPPYIAAHLRSAGHLRSHPNCQQGDANSSLKIKTMLVNMSYRTLFHEINIYNYKMFSLISIKTGIDFIWNNFKSIFNFGEN
jgi:hypothetical protein